MKKKSFGIFLTLFLLLSACGGEEPAAEPEAETAALVNGAFSAELNGFEIHYEVHGAGPVCMVLPVSWGQSHEGMRGSLKGLEDHLTMVYFDPRGMGQSGEIETDADMSIAAVREDCRALLAHLGLESVILLGWSNSGTNAMVYAAEHPEQVEKLILMHTLHYMTPAQEAEFAEQFADDVQALGELMQMEGSDEEKDAAWRSFFVERWLPLMVYNHDAHLGQIVEVLDNTDLSFKHNFYEQTVDMVDFDGREACAQIKAPTLIIAGAHDIYTVEMLETLRDAIAGSTMVVMEESGHFSCIEEPEKFRSAVLEFLAIE